MSKLTIIEFLEARIDEDEARAGIGWSRLGDSRWETDNYGRDFLTPSAVLAECAAKRWVLETLRSYEPNTEWGVVSDMGIRENNAAGAVRVMASVYKDHPDYRREWMPL